MRQVPQPADAIAAVERVAAWLDDETQSVSRPDLAGAVRATARSLAAAHPGGAVELRVPPFVAVQCIAGSDHRRGTPPNVIEMSPRTWLLVVTGRRQWARAVADGEISASGTRADLSAVLPVSWLVA